jgi:hypothetical protein
MKTYDPSPIAALSTGTRTALRATLATAVAAVCAYAALTAGPGNGHQVPRQVQEVTLPTVVIVAKRDAAEDKVAIDDGFVTCRKT